MLLNMIVIRTWYIIYKRAEDHGIYVTCGHHLCLVTKETAWMRNIIKEAFLLVHRAVFITSYCVSYDFIWLFINNSNPYNIYAGNTRIII